MDKIWKPVIYVTIAVLYNLLAHNIASFMYRDMQFDDKNAQTISFLFMIGILGMVISLIIGIKSPIGIGFMLGGTILVLTSVCANWTAIAEEMKLLVMALMLGGVVFYANKRLGEKTEIKKDNISNKQKEEPKQEPSTESKSKLKKKVTFKDLVDDKDEDEEDDLDLF